MHIFVKYLKNLNKSTPKYSLTPHSPTVGSTRHLPVKGKSKTSHQLLPNLKCETARHNHKNRARVCKTKIMQNKKATELLQWLGKVEARAGVEPTYTDLQSGA